MKQELDDYLCTTYPKMFIERNMDMKDTCMCWGFACGDGWFNILRVLCQNIQSHIDWQNKDGEKVPQVVVEQVKEKFGSLRFYYRGGDDTISGMVRMAESMAALTCESCGAPSNISREGGWMSSICPSCREKQQKQYLKQGLEE